MDKVFVYQGALGCMGRLLIWLVGGMWLIATPLVMFSGMKGLPTGKIEIVLMLTIGCLGFILFGRWMVNAHSGEVVLTPAGITRRKGGKERSLAYQDILSVSHRNVTFPELVLRGRGAELVINKNLVDYPGFWRALVERAPQLEAGKGEQREIKVVGKVVEAYVALGIFLLISVVFLVATWIGYFIGDLGFLGCSVASVILVLFITALSYCIAVSEKEWLFTADTVLIRRLIGTKTHPSVQVIAARYGQKWQNKTSRFGPKLAHFLELEFEGGKRVYIDNTSTEYPVEQLVSELTKMWHLEGRLEEVNEALRDPASESSEEKPGKKLKDTK
jgi:hypothetical protein